jgi:hypothetical protein
MKRFPTFVPLTTWMELPVLAPIISPPPPKKITHLARNSSHWDRLSKLVYSAQTCILPSPGPSRHRMKQGIIDYRLSSAGPPSLTMTMIQIRIGS